jgi:hypothetical protein
VSAPGGALVGSTQHLADVFGVSATGALTRLLRLPRHLFQTL